MSGPKHTPGPWKVLNQDLPVHAPRGLHMRVVVTCDMPPRLVTTAAFAEDARLIAAAPDLLEALEELVVTADNMRAWIERQAAATPEDHAVIARARAAIAKAKGESA